ncbi:hypothetical protein [Nocardia blacklockiae]|uniref:hypothetical protein n=1 Tax=Nocardia blacklockiae TaxID=480036 RepID=UPI0018960209|nr:hypothetical protein [Nocardia blacklockiae]MBF6169911.1 hypothetical protein [Nocardia blacklockiae]
MTFLALGYLRTDISRQRQQWDEAQIRSLARRLGYNLCKTIAFSHRTDDPLGQLARAVAGLRAEAVLVPSADHFDCGTIPEELIRITDVITITPQHTYARWPTGELPHAGGM